MRQLSMRILFFSWYDNIVVVKQKSNLPMLVERELLMINLKGRNPLNNSLVVFMISMVIHLEMMMNAFANVCTNVLLN